MMKKYFSIAMAACALILVFTSCAAMKEKRKADIRNEVKDIYAVTWKLLSVRTSDADEWLTPANDNIILTFKTEGQLDGYGGCNKFGGVFETDGEHIKISKLISTRRACPILNVESVIVKALKEADAYVINGNQLLLKKGDVTLFTYEAQL